MKPFRGSENVLIASFSVWSSGRRSPISGNVEPMVEFFTSRVRRTVLVDQPYPGSDRVMPRIEEYHETRLERVSDPAWWMSVLEPILRTRNFHGTHVSFKVRDALSVIDACFRERKPFDYFIGLEAVNAIAGIMMRNARRVKRVIYYVSDYSPQRYSRGWFNALYLWLDRFAARHADAIWDVSKAMHPARIAAGLDPRKSAPVYHVPNAVYPEQIAAEADDEDILADSIVFMGTLGRENGPDVAIQALPLIQRAIPSAILHVIGGGEQDMKRLGQLARELGIDQSIVFHGFIRDRLQLSRTLRRFAVAVAPYIFYEGSPRLYADATKIRAFLSAGVPVVTTHVPPLGQEAAAAGAAIITNDDPAALAGGAVRILKDQNLRNSMRRAALAFASENTWDNEYAKAFEQMHEVTFT